MLDYIGASYFGRADKDRAASVFLFFFFFFFFFNLPISISKDSDCVLFVVSALKIIL